MQCILYIIMLCALYAVACYFYCLKLDYSMLSKKSEVDFLSPFLWVTPLAPCVLLCPLSYGSLLKLPVCSCASVFPACKKPKHKINAAVLPYSAGRHFNCAAACTTCSNPQTSCSTECKHKLVATTGWCLGCLVHVDNLVSTEEK